MDDLIEKYLQVPEDKYLNLDTGRIVAGTTAAAKAHSFEDLPFCSNDEDQFNAFLNELIERSLNLDLKTLRKAQNSLKADQWLNVDTGRKVKEKTAQTKKLKNPQFRICGDKAQAFLRFQESLQQASGWLTTMLFGTSERPKSMPPQPKSKPPQPKSKPPQPKSKPPPSNAPQPKSKPPQPKSKPTQPKSKPPPSNAPVKAGETGPVTRSQTRKQKLIPQLKNQVWRSAFGNVLDADCWCCRKCSISANSFHAGHIHAEAKGGKGDPENLRPICQSCNSSMGTLNMILYMHQNRLDGWKILLKEDPLLAYFSIRSSGLELKFDDFMINFRKWCLDQTLEIWSESVIRAVLKDRGHLQGNTVKF